jgi:hypothetical protein
MGPVGENRSPELAIVDARIQLHGVASTEVDLDRVESP